MQSITVEGANTAANMDITSGGDAIHIMCDGPIWSDETRKPIASLHLKRVSRIRRWICKTFGHSFNEIATLVFRMEYRAGITDAELKCQRCGDTFTLEQMKQISKRKNNAKTNEL